MWWRQFWTEDGNVRLAIGIPNLADQAPAICRTMSVSSRCGHRGVRIDGLQQVALA
jgi:hypothetical protein